MPSDVRGPGWFHVPRTAGLNELLYLVDLHVGCLQVILAGAAVLWALVQRV
jgi:hypothetical protein